VTWLEERGRTFDQCSQHDIDAWFGGGTTTRRHAANLLWWAMRQRLIKGLTVPEWAARTSPALGEQERSTCSARSFASGPSQHATRDRFPGVLYGQRLSHIVELELADIRTDGPEMQIRFEHDWIDVPEPVAGILQLHLDHRPNVNTAANRNSQLLFPGRMPGRGCTSIGPGSAPLRYPALPHALERGSSWSTTRRQRSAEALGISPVTAMRFAERAGSDTALRLLDHEDNVTSRSSASAGRGNRRGSRQFVCKIQNRMLPVANTERGRRIARYRDARPLGHRRSAG